MAIKINGKDLAKRIINWQEVEKVMLNGSQIWPSETPSPYIYIDADFTNYSLPQWWSGSNTFSFTDKWLYYSAWWAWNGYVTYGGLDLTTATKLVSIGRYYLTPVQDREETPFWRWRPNVFWWQMLNSPAGRLYYRIPWRSIWPVLYLTHTLIEWFYTAYIENDLVNWAVTYTLTYPSWDQETLSDTLTSSEINSIKQDTSYQIWFRASTIISGVKIYIYY